MTSLSLVIIRYMPLLLSVMPQGHNSAPDENISASLPKNGNSPDETNPGHTFVREDTTNCIHLYEHTENSDNKITVS